MITGNEIIFLGIAESDVFGTIPAIYPNPVSDKVNIIIDLKKPSPVKINITDLSGRSLMGESYDLSGRNDIVIDVDALPKGIYMLRCEVQGEVIIKKFMKL
jgi:hypothetical protein